MRNIKLTIEYDGKDFNRVAKAANKIEYSRDNRTGNKNSNRRRSGFSSIWEN